MLTRFLLISCLIAASASPALAADPTVRVPRYLNPAGTLTSPTGVSVLDKDGNPVDMSGSAAPNYPASGVAPVSGTFSSTGQSASFTPLAGRGFNASVWGTFAATCQLERQVGSIWQPLTVSAVGSVYQIYRWSAPASETVVEPKFGVPYRINCVSYTSGPVSYEVSQ